MSAYWCISDISYVGKFVLVKLLVHVICIMKAKTVAPAALLFQYTLVEHDFSFVLYQPLLHAEVGLLMEAVTLSAA